ncbi:response regulator [Sphingomonas endolithica]|uniref:response regulator n=1 Tax=Sphingomonas endolithica TaxID=2972485 RepID=UPI0021AF01F7|nr:response regulator [Sphingomonas sp. ZFBP2030]
MTPMTNKLILAEARVLILEDDYYLATDLQGVLEKSGATVLGPCPEPEDAIVMLTRDRPDCALVDINLGSGRSFDLPRALLAANVPFAFVTGYDQESIPAEFANVERLEKPVSSGSAVATMARLIKRG